LKFRYAKPAIRSNGEPLVQQSLPHGHAKFILTLSPPKWTAFFFNPQ
jgi:hypothetical protein